MAPVEHRQRAIIAAQNHFCRIAILTVLILPFARLQFALNKDFAAFLEVILANIDQPLAKNGDRVPFCAFLPLARIAVFPGFTGRDAQIAHLAAILKTAHFWVLAEISNQHDFVQRAGHSFHSFAKDVARLGTQASGFWG